MCLHLQVVNDISVGDSYLTHFRLPQEVVQAHSQPEQSHSCTSPSAMNDGQALVEQRKGIYDHDEFDVFRQGDGIDLSRVHIGKRCDTG